DRRAGVAVFHGREDRGMLIHGAPLVEDGTSLGHYCGFVLNEIAADQLARGDTAQLAELAAEVRLVGVAAGCRHLCDPRGSRAQGGNRPVEPDHTGGGLWRKADVIAEAVDQASRAPSQVRRERSYADASTGTHELPPRPVELVRSRRRVCQPSGEEGLEEV